MDSRLLRWVGMCSKPTIWYLIRLSVRPGPTHLRSRRSGPDPCTLPARGWTTLSIWPLPDSLPPPRAASTPACSLHGAGLGQRIPTPRRGLPDAFGPATFVAVVRVRERTLTERSVDGQPEQGYHRRRLCRSRPRGPWRARPSPW